MIFDILKSIKQFNKMNFPAKKINAAEAALSENEESATQHSASTQRKSHAELQSFPRSRAATGARNSARKALAGPGCGIRQPIEARSLSRSSGPYVSTNASYCKKPPPTRKTKASAWSAAAHWRVPKR